MCPQVKEHQGWPANPQELGFSNLQNGVQPSVMTAYSLMMSKRIPPLHLIKGE